MKNQYSTNSPTVTAGQVMESQCTSSGALIVTNGGDTYSNKTVSGLIKTGAGRVQGIVVNSNSSGTIKLWDNTTPGVTVMFNTMTIAAGERYINLGGAAFATALYATLGGSPDITILYS